jgi:hypothetical protein
MILAGVHQHDSQMELVYLFVLQMLFRPQGCCAYLRTVVELSSCSANQPRHGICNLPEEQPFLFRCVYPHEEHCEKTYIADSRLWSHVYSFAKREQYPADRRLMMTYSMR